ncbi:MAG: hypothetical protein AAF098_04915 [Pseudomonadota bacterium]
MSEALSETTSDAYNLVFSGQLLPGTDVRDARRLLAAFFGLRDPGAIDVFFSGKRIPLRRKLRKEDALKLYRQLRSAGLICEVEEVNRDLKAEVETPETPTASPAANKRKPSPPTQATDTEVNKAPPRATPQTNQRTGAKVKKQAAAAKRASQKGTESELVNSQSSLSAQSSAVSAAPAPSSKAQERTASTAIKRGRRPDNKSSASSPARRPSPGRKGVLKAGQAPNLFALRPALQNEKTEARAEKAQLRAMVSGAIASALLLVLATISIRFPPPPPAPEPAGALAAASTSGNRLHILTPNALLEHERSGLALGRISAGSLGLSRLEPPLLFLDENRILVGAVTNDGIRGLFDCRLQQGVCEYQPGLAADGRSLALARSYLGDAVYSLNDVGALVRISDGKLETAPTPIQLSPQRTRLLLIDGLLHVPAPEGPLLGVYRPDAARLGEQLDALFLLVPIPEDGTVERIHDVAASTEHRWALIESSAGKMHLFRFDRAWGNAKLISSEPLARDSYLLIWRERPLVFHSSQPTAERFSPSGAAEVPFDSSLLRDEHELWVQDERRRLLTKNLGIGLPLFLALLLAIYCWLNVAAARALDSCKAIRTELLDPIPAGIIWAVQVEDRERRIRSFAGLIAALGLGLLGFSLLTAPAAQAAVWVPLVALSVHGSLSMFKGCGGYLGMIGDRSIVVDHDGRYFYGKRSNIHFGERFVVAPDVVVPLGWSWLPNLDASRFHAVLEAEAKLSLRPAARPFIDLLGTLWYLRHPWLRGALTALFGSALSAALYLLTAS